MIDHLRNDTRFRPLTGILFFNANQSEKYQSSIKSFRPLTGILFFNYFGFCI